jgi:hypothetical protein
MAGIKDYSTTAGSNTSVGGVSIAEGMLPSNINNAFRAVTADIREWYNDSQWVIYGDGDGSHTFAYVSGTSFTVNGANVTSIYEAGRRIKAVASTPGTIFGTISSSTFSSNTTVNVTWDSGTLSSESLVVYIAALSVSNTSIPEGGIGSGQLATNAVTTAKITDANVTTAKIADDNVTTAKILDSNVTTAKIADDAVTAAKIADAVLITAAEHAGHTPDEVTLLTTAGSDARYFRQDSSETIESGDTWSAADTHVATTAAIDARIIDLVDDVGGFVPIANETSFPNANPDVNNAAGTIISVTTLGSTHTADGSGVVSISNGSVGNSTVTLNGCGASASLTSGFGILVETTSTLHTYTFVRLIPKATEVTSVAAISSAITGVNNISSAISTVNSNSSNINTVSDSIANVNLTGGSIANVNTTAANIAGVNSFGERYRVASSDPSSSLDEGDLAYNTSDNNLKFYDGSSWTSIAPGIANVVDDSTPQLGGNLDLNSNNITGTGGIPSANLTGTIVDGTLPSTMAGKTLTGATVTTNYNGLIAGGDGGSNDGQIQLNCSQNSHGVKIKAPPHSAAQSYTLTLPSSITNGYFLQTDGSGNLSFAAAVETKPTVADVSQTIAPATGTAINITGTNFVAIPTVHFINPTTGVHTSPNTVSVTNATTLAVNVTLASGSYFVRVENPDGNAARSTNNIITASTAPTFSTGAGSLGTFAGNFSGTLATISASSDSTITFAETTSVLAGAGVTLNTSTGALTTSDFGDSSTTPTTYTFTLRITDAESQTTTREFSMTSSFGATGGAQFN